MEAHAPRRPAEAFELVRDGLSDSPGAARALRRKNGGRGSRIG